MSRKETPPLETFARTSVGNGLGSIIAFLSLIPAVMITISFDFTNDFMSTPHEVFAMLLLMTVICAGMIAIAVACFNLASRSAAAHGPLFFGVVFFILGLKRLLAFEDPSIAPAWGFPVTILGIIWGVIGLIYHRRAMADDLKVIEINFHKMTADNKFRQRMLTTKFADSLQTPVKHIAVVKAFAVSMIIATFISLFALLNGGEAAVDEFVFTPVSTLVLLTCLGAIFLYFTALDEMLRLCLRPVTTQSGKALDERQTELVQAANADARILTLGLMGLVGIIGTYSQNATITGITATLAFTLAYMGPRFILACSLPADVAMNDDDDDSLFIAEQGLI